MSDLHFEGFTLSPEKLSLRYEGAELKLEPRLTELLVYLVRHRDRVVGKEELIESVWQGRFVGDSAISRAIYEVRRALGDDSRNPRFLRTVHGRGYQFIAEVEGLPTPVVSGLGVPSIAAGSLEKSDRRRSETPVLQGAPSSVDSGSWWTPRGGSRLAIPLLIGLVAILIVLLVGLWSDRGSSFRGDGPPEMTIDARAPLDREPPPPSVEANVRLALTPILAGEHAPDLQLVAFSLTDLLYRRLHETPGLSVRSPSYGEVEARSMESLADYAEAAGAEQLLVGSLTRGEQSDTLRVELELVDFEGGRPRATPLGPLTLRIPTSGEDLEHFIVLRDAVVDRVLEILGDALLPPVEDPTRPNDYAAYRLFLLAHQTVFEGGFCDGSGVVELLERSLEVDPEFAPAWTLLAAVHANQVWACGASADHYGKARVAIDRALELSPNYIVPWLVESIILIETGKVELAYQRSLEYVPNHRERAEVLGSRIYSLRFSGFLTQAKATLETLLQIDPLYFARGASGESPNTLLYLGEYQRFLDLLPPSDAAMHVYYRGLGELLLGRSERAREVLEPAFRNNPAAVFARYSQALLAVLDEEFEEATAIVDQIVRQRNQLQANDGEMSYKEAQLYVLCRQPQKALARLEQSLVQGYFSPRYLAMDPLLAAIRDDPRFVEIQRRATERHLAFAKRFGLEPDLPP